MNSDLGNNKIIDIEDNAINGAGGSTKPERVVFVLLENDVCDGSNSNSNHRADDACSAAPRVNAPNFDNPCYNGGSCVSGTRSSPSAPNYTCLCPAGFAGPLCEINIDDCAEHQCQNGAMCVDGINSYRCVCRDPTTSGEFCEQLNSFSTSSANSIAPVALPMVASSSQQQQQQQPFGPSATGSAAETSSTFGQQSLQHPQQAQIQARSAELPKEQPETNTSNQCKRVTRRKVFDDGNGCQSSKPIKMSDCVGTCSADGAGCCMPNKFKRRRIRMLCNDGASYVKVVNLIRRCSCQAECNQDSRAEQHWSLPVNSTQEDQTMQITRIDAID